MHSTVTFTQALYMLRDPGFLKDITDAGIRKNYEEQPSSTEEESLAKLKGIYKSTGACALNAVLELTSKTGENPIYICI